MYFCAETSFVSSIVFITILLNKNTASEDNNFEILKFHVFTYIYLVETYYSLLLSV